MGQADPTNNASQAPGVAKNLYSDSKGPSDRLKSQQTWENGPPS